MNGSHHSSKLPCSTATDSSALLHLASPASSNSSRRWPARAPARRDSSATPGSSSRAARQNGDSGARPPRESQTHAATTPSSRVTRAISVKPGDGIRHEVHDELRERGVEAAVRVRQLVRRAEPDVDARMARTRRGDERLRRIDGRDRVRPEPPDELARQRAGPGADVEHGPLVADAGEVGQLGASGVEYRPMKRSYESAATSKLTASPP